MFCGRGPYVIGPRGPNGRTGKRALGLCAAQTARAHAQGRGNGHCRVGHAPAGEQGAAGEEQQRR